VENGVGPPDAFVVRGVPAAERAGAFGAALSACGGVGAGTDTS